MATVYIYRPKEFTGFALKPTVMVDGKDFINITNGRMFRATFPPGKRVFQMDDKKSGADIDLKAGQSYYMKVVIVPGVFKGGGRMTLVASEQGALEIKQLQPIDANQVLNTSYR